MFKFPVENYTKTTVKELEYGPLPFRVLPDNYVHLHVKHGSKIHNILEYALNQRKESNCKHFVFSGSGKGTTKTVSCAEILKRRISNLHQITKINTTRVEEIWEPKSGGLDTLKVVRDIPAIHILLSTETLDSSEPGYQTPIVVPQPETADCQKDRHFPDTRQKRSRGGGSFHRTRQFTRSRGQGKADQ